MAVIPVNISTNRPVIAANLEQLRYLVFQGMKGDTGQSAYELALALGFEGSEQDWIASLHGTDGADGKNYGIVVDGETPDVLKLKAVEASGGGGGVESVNGDTGPDVVLKVSDLQNDANYLSTDVLRIIDQPTNVVVEDGDVVKTTVTAVGKDLSYQWWYSDDGGANFAKSKITTDTYHVTLRAANSGRRVYCRVFTGDQTNEEYVDSVIVTLSCLSAVGVSGSYNDLTDKPTIPASAIVDSAPTSGSDHAVSSGGVYTALAAKQNTLTFDSTPTNGSTNPVTSGGVYTALQSAGGLEWVNISSDFGFTVAGNLVDAVDNVEAYFCEPLGIVRFAVKATPMSRDGSSSNPIQFSVEYDKEKAYCPYFMSGSDVALGVVNAQRDADLSSPRMNWAGITATYSSSSGQRVWLQLVTSGSTTAGDKLYFTGFYYTEDIPTTSGGES